MIKSRQIDYRVAVITLIVMTVQLLWLEGYKVSNVKVAFMVLAPLLALWRGITVTKALIFSTLFFVVTILLQMLHVDTFRASTHIYTLLFLFSFHLYYGLIWNKKCFTLLEFIHLLEGIMKVFFIFMVLQQVCYIVGLSMPLFNYYGGWKFNSLAIEPSHTARLMTVYMYAYLKCVEYYNGNAPSLKYLWKNHRKVICMFLYMMLTMGSGTAMAGVVIVALYFLRAKYLMVVLPSAFAMYMLAPVIDYEPLNRAMVTANAAMTMDTSEVVKADHSASARVNIILDTITHTDITDVDTWLGRGVDSWVTQKHAVASAITDYGLISYGLKLLFFFSCCFTAVVSIETLILILLFSFNIGNIAYGWACLMVFTTVKYFSYKKNRTISQ
ncbi:MAG: hypothetical protein IKA23_04480 [Akkermansia sp.]|nr:hypothetical protein [Akkermansia sp.]